MLQKMYPLNNQNVPMGVHVPQFGNPCSKTKMIQTNRQ